MFKFASTERKMSKLFLVAVALSLLCNNLVVNGEADDETDETDGIEEIDEIDEGDEDGLLAVRCIYRCSRPYLPVCGSDGKTYGNICHLNTKNKCDHTNIRKVSDGPCPRQRCIRDPNEIVCNQCASGSCNTPANPFLNPFCTRCSNPKISCTNINRPVCGTDGVTYRNACQLAVATSSDCRGYPVRKCHNGPCPNSRNSTDTEEEE